MKKCISFMFLLLVTVPCIAQQKDQALGGDNPMAHAFKARKLAGDAKNFSESIWLRLREHGVALNAKDIAVFSSNVRSKVGDVQFNLIRSQIAEMGNSFIVFINLHKHDTLSAIFRQECAVLDSYCVLECLSQKISPQFSIERRMQAILTILAIYTALEMTAGGKEYLQEIQNDIGNTLKNINTIHMIIPHEGDQDLEIVE